MGWRKKDSDVKLNDDLMGEIRRLQLQIPRNILKQKKKRI